MNRVGIVFGTRPEAVKMVPVIQALKKYRELHVAVINTGQHREMVDQVLDVFDVAVDYRYSAMASGQSLPSLTAKILQYMDVLLSQQAFDLLLVHGDTATALASALAAFYHRIPVGHVEAGLRTPSIDSPFPEEANRRLIDTITQLYFAPTEAAAANLYRTGTDPDQVYVTGNTVIDALYSVVKRETVFTNSVLSSLDDAHPLVVATVHRRENWGQPLQEICEALREAVDRFSLQMVFCMHKNPALQTAVTGLLGGHPRIHLVDAPGYREFAHLLKRSWLVLTDSGGLQEEAPALDIPVLVLRRSTERPEGVEAGTLQLVGTDKQDILGWIDKLTVDHRAYRQMQQAKNPYGDGLAAERIAEVVAAKLKYWGDRNGHSAG